MVILRPLNLKIQRALGKALGPLLCHLDGKMNLFYLVQNMHFESFSIYGYHVSDMYLTIKANLYLH